MKRSIFGRIFFSYVLLTAALSTLIIFFSFRAVKDHYIQFETANLREESRILIHTIDPYLLKTDYKGIDSLLKKLGEKTDTRYTLVMADGTVAGDSDAAPSTMDNHKNRPEIASVINNIKEETAVRFSNTLKEDMLYYASPVLADGKKVKAVIRISIPLKDIKSIADSLNNEILKASILVLLLSVLATFLYSRRFYEPIRDLADAAKKVAARDFDVKVNIKSGDELKALGDSFNYMTSEIKLLFTEVTEKKGQLDAVISSVAEGLIVVDEKGKITLINESFRKLAGTECKAGSFYWECFMPVKFNEIMEFAIKTGRHFSEQVEIKGRMYLVGLSFLSAKKQTAMVLHDITEFKELERIKRDFVANVSHELKTPLTAIKGFTETVEQETKNKESLRYLEIIRKNTERLINIVNDLLTLSQLEQIDRLGVIEEIDLEEVINNTAKIFELAVKNKGLTLKIFLEKGLPAVKGDPFRLEHVFLNLIDNAVKYTEKGGVTVNARHEKNTVIIEVSDTGSGIPEEHLVRVFERFYVVDKSRSKKLGGTGLGLAIVKHIVLLHQGKISVESKVGTGTTFTVTLPV